MTLILPNANMKSKKCKAENKPKKIRLLELGSNKLLTERKCLWLLGKNLPEL